MPNGGAPSISISNAIADDVLCYLSTARHTLPKETIVMNACAYYAPEKILAAKEVIHNVFCERMIARKKSANQPNPTIVDLYDIVNLLEKHDGEDLPKFLASNYNSLPPCGFEPMAAIISSLRDEICAISAELSQLKENNAKDQRAFEEVICIKQDISDIKVSLSSMAKKNFSVIDGVEKGSQQTDASLASAPLYSRALQSNNAAISNNASVKPVVSVVTSELVPVGVAPVVQSNLSTDEAPFRQVRRGRRRRTREQSRVCGTGVAGTEGLAAATQENRDLDIFVGGCSLESTLDDIKNHCISKNINVKNVCILETKAIWYKAYKVTVPASDRDRLLVPELWPHGVFVRKYYNARNNIRQ